MDLSWGNGGDEWCSLETVDLASVDAHGVFVICRGDSPAYMSGVLYVGRGALRDQIRACRQDPLFRGSPELRVTWAVIDDPRLIDGAAAYLYRRLRPLWGEDVPLAEMLKVNPPTILSVTRKSFS